MASIFSRIIAGEIPSYKVAEDDKHYAFLDINPVAPGHTLVVPKHEVDYIFDLPQDEYAELMAFAKKVAKAMKDVMPCKRIGVAVMGLEVPHAHVHLLPINSESDMNFFTEKKQIPADEMKDIAARIFNKFEENETSHPEIF
ncbi:MAG: HIT family protein [Bacteroidales bacterium]|nr:HIT family protein [Bacteroidales bacterium]